MKLDSSQDVLFKCFICIELKSELQVTKAILDTYISKQQQQEAVEGNYNSLFKILFLYDRNAKNRFILKRQNYHGSCSGKVSAIKGKASVIRRNH